MARQWREMAEEAERIKRINEQPVAKGLIQVSARALVTARRYGSQLHRRPQCIGTVKSIKPVPESPRRPRQRQNELGDRGTEAVQDFWRRYRYLSGSVATICRAQEHLRTGLHFVARLPTDHEASL